MTPTSRCSKCRRWKGLTEFARDQTRPSGFSPVCKQCRREWASTYRRDNPRVDYAAKLRQRYGITLAEYDARLEDQAGVCAICGTDEPGGHGGKTFHVDHNHETGEIRGLLCSACNTGLARFRDDPNLLHLAADYLERT